MQIHIMMEKSHNTEYIYLHMYFLMQIKHITYVQNMFRSDIM